MRQRPPSRRDLIRAAAGAAAPWILPSIARGRGRIPPPSERVTLGMIGAGGRGTWLLPQFLALPDAQCVAVCDPFTDRRERLRSSIEAGYAERAPSGEHHGCTAHNDFRELLAREDVDAVVIATPDHWHVPIATAAVRAGKDVYVEKPLGLAVTWNQALRETVQRYGAVFQYGTQQRSDRNFRHACELARNGVLGDLERIEAWCPGMAAPGWYETTSKGGGSTAPIPVPDGFDYDLWLGPAPASPYTKDRCSEWGAYHVYDNSIGFIAGWGAHPLDIAQWGNGTDGEAPVFVEGKGTINAEGLFDTIRDWDVHCRYANGVTMRFLDARTAQDAVEAYRPFNDHGTTFFGAKGWVSVDRGGIYASDPAWLGHTFGPDDIHLYESGNHYANFVGCVRSRARAVCTVEAAVQSDVISHLGDISIRLGHPLRWDPAAETISGDEAAARLLHRPLRSPWRL
ncbi:MAG: Gfo/Idh/MocA family oxidoreductase [Planctomycetota bacterium]